MDKKGCKLKRQLEHNINGTATIRVTFRFVMRDHSELHFLIDTFVSFVVASATNMWHNLHTGKQGNWFPKVTTVNPSAEEPCDAELSWAQVDKLRIFTFLPFLWQWQAVGVHGRKVSRSHVTGLTRETKPEPELRHVLNRKRWVLRAAGGKRKIWHVDPSWREREKG